ncbi:MAG: hypothetical protein ACREEK_27310 [Bradyrhizobium sp.]
MKTKAQLLTYLRQHFRAVEGTTPHDAWDFTHQFGNAVDALLYVPLYCPEFIEVDGSILLNRMGSDFEKRFVEVKRTSKLALTEIESSFNVLELGYAFSDRTRVSNGENALLAESVAEAWRARLVYLYSPGRFEVSVRWAEQTGDTAEVHFFELR